MGAKENLQFKSQFSRSLQQVIDERPRFEPAFSFFGGHGQTILGHLLTGPRRFEPAGALQRRSDLRAVSFPLQNGDELHGLLHTPSNSSGGVVAPQAIVHIFHGLAGSTESNYMPRAASACVDLGLYAVLWNHRGCGTGRHRAIGTYHSGRSDDLACAIRWGRQNFSGLPQIIIGYSLSGNAAILLSAGIIPAKSSTPFSRTAIQDQFNGDLPDFTIAVSPPIDLYLCAWRLSRSGSRLYGQRFMIDLFECLKDRELIRVDQRDENSVRLHQLAVDAKNKLRPWDSVLEFDRLYTGLAGGFADYMDYYRRASSGQALGRQIVPLVVLTADDDPITHGLNDLTEEKRLLAGNDFVIDRQAHGGHMGFVDKYLLEKKSSATHRWMERRLQLYLEHYLKMYLAQK
jgi:predicted alpha/beta-fold hydrolase